MFEFVNRFSKEGICIYNGDPVKARNTFDKDKSIKRFERCRGDYDIFEIKIYDYVFVQKLPIRKTEVDFVDVTRELQGFIAQAAKDKRLNNDLLIRCWQDLFKHFDVLEFNGLIKFRRKKVVQALKIDDGLRNMKNFITGFNRFEPLINNKGKAVSLEQSYYPNHPKGQNYHGIKYTYKGQEFSTPLHGVFVPQFTHSVFSDLEPMPNGGLLQTWQKLFMFLMVRFNVLLHSRGGGKTILLHLILFLCAYAQNFNRTFKTRPPLINYWAETDSSLEDVIDYIQFISDQHNQSYFKLRISGRNKYMEVITHIKQLNDKGEMSRQPKVVARVRFRTAGEKGKGRGGRVFASILDEADRLPYDIYKAAYGNYMSDRGFMFLLTTVNIDSSSGSRVYPIATNIAMKMMSYEPMEDLVVRIRRKYGFDRRDSPEKIDTDIWKQANKEFFSARPDSCLRFNVDDIEYMTEDEKMESINGAIEKGMTRQGVLSEFYSIIMQADKIFNYSGLMEVNIPDKFDDIALGFDQGGEADNPVLVSIGIRDGMYYILNSYILGSDIAQQVKTVKTLRNHYSGMLLGDLTDVSLIVDITQNPHDVDSFKIRGLHIDTPLYFTGGGEPNWEKRKGKTRKLNASQKVIIKEASNIFSGGYVRISAHLESQRSGDNLTFTEELDNFGSVKTSETNKTYKGLKGKKDDQVFAMALALYQLNSVLGYKGIIAEQDNQAEGMRDDISEEEQLEIIKEYNADKEKEGQDNFGIISFGNR